MLSKITSHSNPKIKEVIKLRDGKERRRTGRFLIDGFREMTRAFQSGIRILEIFAVENALVDFPVNLFDCSFYVVSEAVGEKIAFGNRRREPVAVAETPIHSLERFESRLQNRPCPLLAVLEGVEKPGNVGAVFRSADGAGFDGILVADPGTDLFNPNTVRSSLGTVFGMPATCLGAPEAIAWLRQKSLTLAVARCDGAIPYTEYDFQKPTAIVLGSEAEGLTDLWQGSDVVAISLPMLGTADSLNVSNAAAVLFYEARRRRDGRS